MTLHQPVRGVALKHAALSIQTGPFGSQLHADDYETGGRPVVNPAHLQDGRIEPDPDSAIDEDTFQRLVQHELRPGDVVIGRRGELGRCGVVTPEQAGWVCGTGSIRVRPDPAKLEPRWLRWLLSWPGTRDWLSLESVGTTMENLGAETVGSMPIALPAVTWQCAIADYLDRETARIDALIAAKERLLGLLAEKRRALITRAVTRGGDPNVPLRDSGIPWLGKIPAHWALKRLKHVGRAIIGLTFDPANEVQDGRGVLVLRASNVRGQRIVLEDNVYVSMQIPEELRTREGDILICARSGSRALIGKNALIDSSTAGLTFGAFMTVFRSPHNAFLFYVFNSPLFDYQAGAFSTSTINQLTVETLNGMEIALPPLAEQEAIIKGLCERLSELDSVVGAIVQTVSLLRERRSGLIAAAVTGKIAVEAAA